MGGIAKKPGVIGNKIEIREYLCMTILFDHNVVDGAPAARFIARLAELVENGFGLIEEQSWLLCGHLSSIEFLP